MKKTFNQWLYYYKDSNPVGYKFYLYQKELNEVNKKIDFLIKEKLKTTPTIKSSELHQYVLKNL